MSRHLCPPPFKGSRNMLHGKLGHTLDIVAGSVILGSLAEWLPPTAAFFGLIYTVIRIYETDTFQKILKKFKRGPEA